MPSTISESQFSRLVALSPVGMIVLGKDGLPRFANPAADTLFGYRILEGTVPLFGTALEGNERKDLEIPRKNGGHITVQAQITDVEWDDEPAYLASLQEITERDQVEALLRENEEKIRFQAHLLDFIPEAIIALDTEGKVMYRNHFAESLYGWSSPPSDNDMSGDSQGLTLVEISWVKELEIIARASKDKDWSGELIVHCQDGSTFPAIVNASPIHDGNNQRIGTLMISANIERQKDVEHRLERYIRRLENLREIDHAMLFTRSPESIADTALHHIRQIVPCPRISVSLFDKITQEPVVLAVQSAAETRVGIGKRHPPHTLEQINTLRQGQILFVENIEHTDWPAPILESLLQEGIRCFVRLPLIVTGELIGTLSLGAFSLAAFTQERLEIAREVADHLAIALQNARLHNEIIQHATQLEQHVVERTAKLSEANQLLLKEVQEHHQTAAAEHDQRTLAEALRETAAVLHDTLDLDQVLDRIFTSLQRVVPFDSGEILFVDSGSAYVVRTQGNIYGEDKSGDAIRYRFSIGDTPNLREISTSGKPFLIPDVSEYPDWIEVPGAQKPASCVGSPIYEENAIIGFLILMSNTAKFFTAEHAHRLETFSYHAAIAIQNARLYKQAQNIAIIEERQRLARELHDSVSQTLWSASLIADVLPSLWEQNPGDGRQAARRLRQLARGALAEMRMLLWELHPTALTDVKLDELLQRLTEVTTSRTGVPVKLTLDGKPILPPDVQIAIYRIVQEALGNVARHAAASQISVNLHCEAKRLELSVKDNGHGFIPEHIQPGHLGLTNMRERAQSIGAEFNLDTRPGEGTDVLIRWSGLQEGS